MVSCLEPSDWRPAPLPHLKIFMRFCYNCHRLTGSTPNGEPLFCSFCGRTYNTKYCHRLHPNPRSAEVCAQCGSKDLTTPQPKVPFLLSPLLFLLTVLPGMLQALGRILDVELLQARGDFRQLRAVNLLD